MKRTIKTYPLCEAVINSDMNGFNTLLDSNVDLEGTDYNGITALMYAVELGNIAMAKKLIEKGSSIECKDSFGNTPLIRACFRFSYNENGIEMIRLLISCGANVNARNKAGISPKSFAKTTLGFPEIDALKD